MGRPIQNRYDFLLLFDCEKGNPNGDPDAANAPRMDPEDMHGLVSDVAIKRKIRNYVQIAEENKSPFCIFISQGDVLNRTIQTAHAKLAELDEYKKADNQKKNEMAKQWMCKNFYDVRAFGAVMSTNKDENDQKTTKNAGQVRGAVQLTFSRSIDPILPLEPGITRMAVATVKEQREREEKGTENQTMGRKNLIPYGLYACQGFISAHLAEQTGFTEEDLSLLWKSLENMFDHDRSAARGMMAIRGLKIFKHVGTDTNAEQRARQAKLGCAPAQKLVELDQVVEVKKVDGVSAPRRFSDYKITIHKDRIPKGVELIERV